MMKRRIGFTLIELLVVISIIAVLIALLLPALQAAKARARIAVCASNMRSLGVGASAYADANDGHLTPIRFTVDKINGVFVKNRLVYWFTTIRPYLSQPQDFGQYPHIGYANRDANGQITDQHVGWTVPGLSCPEREWEVNDRDDAPAAWFGINYGVVVGLSKSPPIDTLDNNNFLFTDTRSYYALSPLLYPLEQDPFGDGENTTGSAYPGGWQFIYNSIRPRHPGGDSFTGSLDSRGLNFMFVDGHVGYRSFRQWLDNDGGIWGDQLFQ